MLFAQMLYNSRKTHVLYTKKYGENPLSLLWIESKHQVFEGKDISLGCYECTFRPLPKLTI